MSFFYSGSSDKIIVDIWVWQTMANNKIIRKVEMSLTISKIICMKYLIGLKTERQMNNLNQTKRNTKGLINEK